MAPIAQIRVALSNFTGAPGVCTFFCLDPATWRPDLVAFWNTVTDIMPLALIATVEAQGDILDDVTGAITGTWTEGAAAPFSGADDAVYAGGSGAVINWQTADVVPQRKDPSKNSRVKGRTFLVPMGGQAYDSAGSLATTPLNYLRTAATALADATPGQMLIWHRPVAAGPAGPEVTGSSHAVVSASVPDLAAVLRSRRT